MKILWVKAGKLLPVDTGGKIRSFNILRQLAKNHEVTLLSYYGGTRDSEYEAAITQKLPQTETIHTAAPESFLAQSLDYVLRLSNRAPYAVTKFTHPKVRRRVAELLRKGEVDIAVCDFLSASLNFPDPLTAPVALFQHNVESVLWQRMARTERAPWRKISYAIEARKMAAYETQTLQRFQHVIAVSENDREAMLTLSPGCSITVVPTGVDTEEYQASPSVSGDPPVVLFTGSMDWEPNIDAMEYFCEQIWPRILASFPDARFQIVGRNPQACRSNWNRCVHRELLAFRYGCCRTSAHWGRYAAEDFRSHGHGEGLGFHFHRSGRIGCDGWTRSDSRRRCTIVRCRSDSAFARSRTTQKF
jgi:glycosyltransferase involved in cell wall biosynthesis